MIKSSIHTLMGVTSDFIRVQSSLRDIIVEAQAYDNPQRYVAFRSGTVRGSWFAKNYLSTRKNNGMKNAISIASNCTEGREASRLEMNIIKETAQAKGITNNKNFIRLETILPIILKNIAGKEKEFASTLFSLSDKLTEEVEKTERAMSDLKDQVKAEKIKDKEVDLLGQQNVAVEAIVSATLATLDKKLAHHLRQLIAKSDNKLQILERELANI